MSTLRRLPRLAIPAVLTTVATILACAATSAPTTPDDSGDPDTPDLPAGVPAMYSAFGNGVTITLDGNHVVIHTKDLPDHKSPYYSQASGKHEAYTGTNALWSQNPNAIAEQAMTFRIPVNPVQATNVSATPLGPIGIATNGVAIFNQYAAGRSPLAGEINGFDQYGGHPQQMGQYHYHVEPLWLTRNNGRDKLVGVLLDGFPVYGPMENGHLLTSADLDAAHGHVGPTAEFPAGIYHYHTTADAPYINGSGFRGTPGTVAQ